jgi:hypothetical protein
LGIFYRGISGRLKNIVNGISMTFSDFLSFLMLVGWQGEEEKRPSLVRPSLVRPSLVRPSLLRPSLVAFGSSN